MFSKGKIIIFGVFFILFFFPQEIKAFSFQITGVNPLEVNSIDQEVQVNLSITDLISNSYFIVGWQKGGEYNGYTKINDSWIKINTLTSENCSGYMQFTDATTTSSVFITKLGDDYKDNGDYIIKVIRFTSTCKTHSLSSESTDFVVNIALPTSTPTPTPSPTPSATPTPSPTETSAQATSTPSSTPQPTSLPTATPKKTPVPSPSPTLTPTPQPDVMGVQNQIDLSGNASQSGELTDKKGPPIIPIILVGSGAIFIAVAGFALAKKGKSEYNLKDENINQTS